MDTNEFTRKIFLRLGKFKWLVLAAGIAGAAIMFFYARTIAPVYTAKATVFPLTGSNENPTSSAISTLLGGGDAPKSFSSDASINIVELALSRNTREYVVMRRLPQFGNKRIAELLIESYNNHKKSSEKKIDIPSDTLTLVAIGSGLLSERFSAKILKSGILEVSFSNTNKAILTPVSNELINKISQFYIDLKIKKAKRDYDFTIKKVDSLQAILDVYDKQAIRMNKTTLFVPISRMEYSIPKENLINAKERIMRLRDASANNREEALWRLQKATPIIATLDKPEPPFDIKRTSSVTYGSIGLGLGFIIAILFIIAPLVARYVKAEANKAIFGDEHAEQNNSGESTVTTTA